MNKNKLFGTDGVRGKANQFPMTPEVALALGEAIAYYFAAKKGGGKIVIGKDTRRSSYMFELALSAGISSMGAQAILTGPMPTPAIAFLTKAMRADAGVVISASHNSFDDNGIKFFDANGYKLPDEIERQLEEFVFQSKEKIVRPYGEKIGRAIRIEDAAGRYIEFLKNTFPKNLSLEGLKIVIDCANGAGYSVGPMLLQEMGAEVVALSKTPNGININKDCGALHPENLCKAVIKEKAALGIALDGDADRLILVDETGTIIDGDQILALCSLEMQKMKRLKDNTVVGTVMSNMGLEVYLKEMGIKLIRTQVGDRYIVEQMRTNGYTLGGEPSGHLIFGDVVTTGDALIAALQVMAVMVETGKKLSELAHRMPIFPQKTENIPVKEKKDLSKIATVQQALQEVEKEMAGAGRVILRYSGTEPLLRLTVEAQNDKMLSQSMTRLQDCLQSSL